MDTRQVVARFEAERQALALMDHPNIARVLDAGATDTGRPFFVMELVRGIPITKFCEENQLPIPARLDLFLPVCQAIQHAHQKGIIHRDIKPSNVLVTLNDGVPHPLVIDFGVAKAIDQRLTDKTLFTRFAQIIGTPAYMSPEQAEMSRHDVDTRADVYSLGILLYELLTGTTPFPEERLRTVGFAELQRIISEEEPVRPSALVSRMNGKGRTIARNRRLEPAALIKHLKGDLDWIVLKAIDKDRNRRYDTPKELAADIGRFLADKPIHAHPISRMERFGRWVRRKPALAASMLAISLLLLVVFIGSPLAAYRINEARRHADEQAQVASAINDFLTEDLLRQADVWKAEAHASPNRDVRLLEIVNRAADGIESRFSERPSVAAKIHLTVGSVYAGLGETAKAEQHLRQAKTLYETQVGPDDLRTLEVDNALAVLLRVNKAAFEEAETLIRHVLQERARQLGPNQRDTLAAKIELAWLRSDRDAPTEAEALFQQAAQAAETAFGPDDPLTLSARDGIASTLWDRGNRDEATERQKEILEARKKVQGKSHPDTVRAQATLAFYVWNYAKDARAKESLVDEGLEMSRRVFGEWGTTAWLEEQRSGLLGHKGLYAEGLALRAKLFDEALAHAGPEHPATLNARRFLGFFQTHFAGQDREALSTFEEILLAFGRVAPDSYNAQTARAWLASMYQRLGRWDDALALRGRILEINRRLFGDGSRSTQSAMRSLAALRARTGDWIGASDLFDQMAREPQPSPIDVRRADVIGHLARRRDATGDLVRLALDQFAEESAAPDELRNALVTLGEKHDAGASADLRRLNRQSADPQIRLFSAFLLAEALHLQGATREAQSAFSEAENSLNLMIRSGDLGPRWSEVALSLVARERAGRMLDEASPLPSMNASHLARARAQWESVRISIDHAFALARNRRWSEAAASIKATMASDRFAWDAAEATIPRWPLKLAIIFALANDEAAYGQVCMHYDTRRGIRPARMKAITLFPLHSTETFSRRFFVNATEAAFTPETEGLRQVPEWENLLSGIELLADGDLKAAAEQFAEAQKAYDLHCSCAAYAFAAQALSAYGNSAQAKDSLRQAESQLDLLKKNQLEALGTYWFEFALCEIAIQQARQRE